TLHSFQFQTNLLKSEDQIVRLLEFFYPIAATYQSYSSPHSISLIILAGLPPTTTLLGTAFVTTAPDAITALFPIVIPGLIIAPPPIHTLFPMVIGFPYSLPELRSVGCNGWVAVKILTLGPNIQSLPIRISHTSKKIQSKLA